MRIWHCHGLPWHGDWCCTGNDGICIGSRVGLALALATIEIIGTASAVPFAPQPSFFLVSFRTDRFFLSLAAFQVVGSQPKIVLFFLLSKGAKHYKSPSQQCFIAASVSGQQFVAPDSHGSNANTLCNPMHMHYRHNDAAVTCPPTKPPTATAMPMLHRLPKCSMRQATVKCPR